MDDNYIIFRDEDGKAYIAHAGWLDNAKNAAQQVANKAKGVGRGVRQNHKYILKVIENGKTRYFYKQEEVKAYYEAKRKGIKNPAEYAQKAAEAASNAVDAVKNAASKAGNAAKSAFREATGQAARDRMDEAANRRDTEAANMQANKQNREASRSNVQSARQATREAEAERNRSEAALKGLKDKMKSNDEKAVDVTSRAVDAMSRKYAAESKARRASLDSALSMPWEFKKRKDAKTAQADASREAQQAEKEQRALNNEYDRINKSRELTKKAYSTELAKSNDAWNQRAQALRDQDAAEKSHQVAQDKFNESRAAYREADSDYKKNKAAYDKSLAGAVDRTAARARDVASDAREAASSAYNKAKDSANNTVTNAKNRFERMKSEFKNKAQKTAQAAVDATINKAAYEAPRAAAKVKETASDLMDTAKRKTGITAKEDVDKAEQALNQAKRDSAKTEQVRREVTKNGEPDSSGNKWYKTEQEARRAGDAELAAERAHNEVINKENSLKYARSRYEDTPLGKAQGMIDKARTAVKDKSEDLSAKAKSTVQSARDSVQGMIDNARSSTAKAVNEAWDKIPKNADGTVNPFDKNFKSTYNDWKAKKDKYDSSLAGRAKDTAEKATDAVQNMIDKAKKVVKGNSGSKSTYGEYSDNDSDFDEKNYSRDNYVEDTDFYTFKRDDGKWVVLEEDMKWVLPDGVSGNDPGIKNALKQFSDHASSARVIGNENYTNSQWVNAVTEAIDKASEKVKKDK